MIHGPKVNRLIIYKMSCDAVPTGGGIADAIAWLAKPGAIGTSAREAEKWVSEAIAAVKSAPDNKWSDDDEAIAGEILARISERSPTICPKCGGFRTHFRLKGYRCMRCD